MIDSAVWLDGELGEGAGGSGEVVVEPDACGEGEEFGRDARSDAVQGAGVVAFEAEAVFQCPEDALDALADRGQVGAASGLVLAAGSQDGRAEALAGRGLEVAAGVALVGDDQLAAVQAACEEPERDIAFLLVGRGEDRGAWGAV